MKEGEKKEKETIDNKEENYPKMSSTFKIWYIYVILGRGGGVLIWTISD